MGTNNYGKAGLNVVLVSSLAEALSPVAGALSDVHPDTDLFRPEYVIVPTAGVRAWLISELATRLGVGTKGNDGVVANVTVGYLGLLDRIVGLDESASKDAWSIENMTAHLLRIFTTSADPYHRRLMDNHGGPLRAARHMADRFDRYAARRPLMIAAWENGAPVLSPQADSALVDGEVVPPALDQRWRGQFDLWRDLRSSVGEPPPPVVRRRMLEAISEDNRPGSLPERLHVVGLQSISLAHLEVLRAIGRVCRVDVYFVHPSPALARATSAALDSVDVTVGRLPLRPVDHELPDGFDPFVGSWLRGATDLQKVLASQGVDVDAIVDDAIAPASHQSPGLLGRIRALVVNGGAAKPAEWDPSDQSLRIHRCHHLYRQVEVLFEALAHAFRDLPDLRPHEVVVLCADIAAAEPLLRGVFDRSVVTIDGKRLRIPLVVADRSLRQTSDAVNLLGELLDIGDSRFTVGDVLSIATNPLVTSSLGATNEDTATWRRIIDDSRVRWGTDVEHRRTLGFDSGDDAHTWLVALRRALLGAMLAEGPPAFERGGIVPMSDLEVSDISSLSRLVHLFGILTDFESARRIDRPIVEFCDLVERALVGLGGSDSADLGHALEVLGSVRRGLGVASDKVAYSEFASLVGATIDGAPGSQPLRTGAVTATSLVPLRGVPYRVICLIGFDDGATSVVESESGDLTDAQRFIGDIDARIDQRRTILDVLMSASDRVIITCNGRSIKNNTPVPMVTPLQELSDVCLRLGVPTFQSPAGETCAAIEIIHPRHAVSESNFVPGGIISGAVWSSDAVARDLLSSGNHSSSTRKDVRS